VKKQESVVLTLVVLAIVIFLSKTYFTRVAPVPNPIAEPQPKFKVPDELPSKSKAPATDSPLSNLSPQASTSESKDELTDGSFLTDIVKDGETPKDPPSSFDLAGIFQAPSDLLKKLGLAASVDFAPGDSLIVVSMDSEMHVSGGWRLPIKTHGGDVEFSVICEGSEVSGRLSLQPKNSLYALALDHKLKSSRAFSYSVHFPAGRLTFNIGLANANPTMPPLYLIGERERFLGSLLEYPQLGKPSPDLGLPLSSIRLLPPDDHWRLGILLGMSDPLASTRPNPRVLAEQKPTRSLASLHPLDLQSLMDSINKSRLSTTPSKPAATSPAHKEAMKPLSYGEILGGLGEGHRLLREYQIDPQTAQPPDQILKSIETRWSGNAWSRMETSQKARRPN
jgi:hypothetical protein